MKSLPTGRPGKRKIHKRKRTDKEKTKPEENMPKLSNLIVRTITGLVFVALVTGAILWHPLAFGLLFACITALTLWEFAGLVNKRPDVQINQLITTVAGTYFFFAIFGYFTEIVPSSVFIPYLLSIIYLLISELYLRRTSPMNNWAYSMLSQLYIALPLALLSVLAFQTDPSTHLPTYHGILPLSVFLLLWASDSGAYCVGTLLGKHPLFKRISPHKSWEGSIGGGLVALIVALILAYFVPSASLLSPLQWAGLALVVVIFGTWGDLVESLLKRQLNIKDSGTILPGHGGMLDRFDSALMAIPASVIYLYTIALF
jgi:phosphatidate cytidylyltransferase